MAKVRVKSGRRGPGIAEALEWARPGDTLIIDEGVHWIGSIYIHDLTLRGKGSPEKVVLVGQIEPRGNCRLVNLTVRAPEFHNALTMAQFSANLRLLNCIVYGDPTLKYPAIYAAAGQLELTETMVYQEDRAEALQILARAALVGLRSGVGGLYVSGGRANLRDVTALSVIAVDGARVETEGLLEIFPPKGRRVLVLSGESVCTVSRLQLHTDEAEALCAESVLQLDEIKAVADSRLRVIKEGHAVVEVGRSPIDLSDPSQPHSDPFDDAPLSGESSDDESFSPEPSEGESINAGYPEEMPSARREDITWKVDQARHFRASVASRLAPGDRLIVGPGEFFLDDQDEKLVLRGDLIGATGAEKTVLRGSVAVMGNTCVKISDLTIIPNGESPAIELGPGGALQAENLVIALPTEPQIAAVQLSEGTATFDNCVLTYDGGPPGLFVVEAGASLIATGSALGRLLLRGAKAELVDCSSHGIWASAGSVVTSDGVHRLTVDETDVALWVHGNSEVQLHVLVTTGDFEARVESGRAALEALAVPQGSIGIVGYRSGAQVDFDPGQVELFDLDEGLDYDVDGEEESQADTSENPSGDTGMSPLDQIMEMTGLATVKEQIQTFVRMVKFNQLRRDRGLKSSEVTMHSVFLGNPGTGKTTVARLLGSALAASGAIRRNTFVEVERRDLVGQHLGESANLTRDVLERARGGVLFIDEAYSLYQEQNNEFGQEAVDALVTFMENNRDEIVVILAGYPDRMHDFFAMNPGIRSRVPNRFDFEDYVAEEIAAIGYQMLTGDDYRVDEALYRRVVASRYVRSSDKSNGRWIRNFNERLMAVMANRILAENQASDVDLSLITEADLFAIDGGDPDLRDENINDLLRQLDGMVGLQRVKDWVRRLINRAKVDQQRMELDGSSVRPTYHMVFSGNPGTGKTTVAKIIAQLFHNLGILESPTVKVVDRGQLVGQWIGHTEARTARAIDEAMGGVLFVDEAYQLDVTSSENDFGKVAIETFVTRLENDREKFVAIFAGYSEEMDALLQLNPGLRSRIPLSIEFPDFSPAEVAQIVVADLQRRWRIAPDAVAAIAERAYAALGSRDRSNGRWARNFVERVEAEHSEYLAATDITGVAMKQIPVKVVQAAAGEST